MREKEQGEKKGQGEIIAPPASAMSPEEEATSPDGDRRKVEDRPRDSNIKEELNELLETLPPGDREVDSLQVKFTKQKWYQESTTWISILALIVSLVVLILGFVDFRFRQQERLTTLIQQLSEIRGKIVELQLEYDTKAPIPSVELRQPLIEEALELHRVVRANSFQKMIIAQSLNETNQPDRAQRIAEEAESLAKNRLERVLAAQVLGVTYFNQGNPPDGRRAYSRALAAADITDPAGSVDIFAKALYKLETEQVWISGELRIGNCSGAKERLLKLESYGREFPRMQADEFEKRVQPSRDIVAKICPCSRDKISYPPGGIIKPAACDDVNFGGFVVPFRLLR